MVYVFIRQLALFGREHAPLLLCPCYVYLTHLRRFMIIIPKFLKLLFVIWILLVGILTHPCPQIIINYPDMRCSLVCKQHNYIYFLQLLKIATRLGTTPAKHIGPSLHAAKRLPSLAEFSRSIHIKRGIAVIHMAQNKHKSFKLATNLGSVGQTTFHERFGN